MASITDLKRALKTTSTGWTRLVVPAGTNTGSVLHSSRRNCYISSDFWARWTSRTSIMLSWQAGFHCWRIQDIITLSSTPCILLKDNRPSFVIQQLKCSEDKLCHVHVFKDIRTFMHLTFSLKDIHFPLPLKIISGFTVGSPSANKVICAVHCCLSRPEVPPLTHTVLSPVSA